MFFVPLTKGDAFRPPEAAERRGLALNDEIQNRLRETFLRYRLF